MITEKKYDNNETPQDKIYNVKKFINELENVQTFYYNQLFLDLNLKDEAHDFLFDYIHNKDYDLSFDDFLKQSDKSYKELCE
jgi:hypothetical protein